MARFFLITQGVLVSYHEDGFSAFGRTTNFEWQNQDEDAQGESLPRFDGEIVEWQIDTSSKSLFDRYRSGLSDDEVTKRENLLKKVWAEHGQPVISMERCRYKYEGGPAVVIHISYPPDASLAAFITPIAMADKELLIRSGGWQFLSSDREAPAVSLIGWDERFEPAFSSDLPILSPLNKDAANPAQKLFR